MVDFNFTDKKVLVFGGSRGIGQGVVKKFLYSGAEVFYAARTQIEDTRHLSAKFFSVDLNNEKEIVSLFDKLDDFGGVDIVVNAAAINFCNIFDQISIDEWDNVLSINLRASFILCQQAAIRMKKKRHGKIVNISSIAGRHRSIVSGVHYVSSKAGVVGLTKQLAYELGPYNVNVNVVCPSQTLTKMLEESMTDKELKSLENSIPLRRIATIEDQVDPILFLCSDSSSYITGAVIDVNGGQL
jgi:3-oxoacyl-[acyl-carrier protein] reductase